MNFAIALTVGLYLISAVCYLSYLFYQKEHMQRYGYWLLLAGFVIHSLHIGYAYISSGHIPVQNLHQTLSIAGWALAGAFLGFQYRYKLKILGVLAVPLIAAIMVITLWIADVPAGDTAIFKSSWLTLHILLIFLGEAAFALACGAGILYLVQENAIKSKRHGFFYKRLPALELLDTTGYACLVAGFTLLTVGLITGFIYAKAVWGRFFSGDPKEIWSAISWALYAALLHGRLTIGWRGRRAAIMAIIGFAVLLFTFLGVNFLLKGHHGVFTRF